jgi:Holliday junction resolvase RusA-like endonuclease
MQLPIRINIKPKPTPRPRVKTIYKNGKGINCTYYPPEYQSYKDELCLILKQKEISLLKKEKKGLNQQEKKQV